MVLIRFRPFPTAGTRPGPLLACGLLVCLSSCASPPRADPGQVDDARAALHEAAAAMIAQDPESALLSLDRTARYRDLLPPPLRAEIELSFGEANLRFAQQQRARAGNGTMIRASYLDAEAALARAEQDLADSTKPVLLLAETLHDQGKYAAAAAAATRAIDRIVARDGAEGAGPDLVDPLVLRARARIPELARARQAEEGEPGKATRDLAGEVLADIGRAQALDPRRPEPYQLASTTFRWVGDFGRAARMLEDGIRADPSYQPHHTALHALYGDRKAYLELAGLYERLAKEVVPPSADVVWYAAWAEYSLAWSFRSRGDRKSADRRYDMAEAGFARCARMNPSYAGRCAIRRAICAVAKAHMGLDDGDEKVVEAELDRAWTITPEIAATDDRGLDRWADHFQKTYRNGIYALGARFMGRGGGRLAEARRFFRKVTQRHPTWGPAWNDLGLACRDLGAGVERRGDPARARTLFEEGFAAYKRAAVLEPDDPRIQNDCGLMLVYHLHRDPDFAVAQFEKAIRLGMAQLEDLPEKSDGEDEQTRRQRNFLEEAVGDAWQNQGRLHEQQGELGPALESYRKAAEFYPYRLREAARRIPVLEQALRDKRGIPAGPEGKRAAPVGALAPAVLLLVAPGPDRPQQNAVAAALARLDAGDAEAALDLVEPLLDERKTDAEVWYVAGRGSLLFAQQRIAQHAKGANENLVDAVLRLEKAHQLTHGLDGGTKTVGDRIHLDPTAYLVTALVLRGEPAAAWTLGRRHLTHLDSLGIEFRPADLASLLIAVADAGTRKVVADLKAGKQPGADADAVRSMVTETAADLAKIADRSKIDVLRLCRAWSDLEEWTGRHLAAIRAWGRGAKLAGAARRGPFLNGMLAVAGRAGGAAAALAEIDALLATSRDATTLWYRGYAGVLAGNELRLASKAEAAPAAYAGARRDLAAAVAKNAGFARSASWWTAVASSSEGWCAEAAGNEAAARRLWLAAVRENPSAAAQKDALGRSAKDGVLALGGSDFRAGKFVEGAQLMEDFLQALGKDDVDALNNIGLFLREHATRLPEGRAREQALRRSWAAYQRAVVLAPDNPRLLNDAALIDVYYLHEHRAAAERLLEQAIDAGQGRLDDDPPADAQQRRDLEEAVGDARMNLGLMLVDAPARWDEAERELRRSLDYWPGARRASQRHLRRLMRLRRAAKRKAGAAGKGKG